MTKKTFRVLDMHCSNCPMNIESIEDELPGIIKISASYHKQQMMVEFDDSLVTDELILSAVKKKGYTAVPD
jgi:copper chaperone CopZ